MNEMEPYKAPSGTLMDTGLLLLCFVFLLLAGFILRQEYEKQNLRDQLQFLEDSLEQEQKKNQLRLDSLQHAVALQRKGNRQLKDSLLVIQQRWIHLKEGADEKKAAIIRIRDVDSLRAEVAKHYN